MHKHTFTTVFLMLLMAALAAACEKKDTSGNAFKEHWKNEAETRQGWSPSPADLRPEPRIVMQHSEPGGTSAQRSLPTMPVTLKLHDVDAGVVLRSLAAAAGINIMLSPGVSGTVSLNVRKTSWRDVFLGILSSNGLEHRWQGNILQVLTAAEKQKEIGLLTLNNQLSEQQSQARHTGPLSLTVVSVRYSDANELKESLARLIGQQKDAVIDIDKHTNSLILQCAEGDKPRLLELVDRLDRPRPQVQLKAYIVETTKETARELGMKWGGIMKTAMRNGFYAGSSGAAEFGTNPVTGGFGTSAGISGLPMGLDYSGQVNGTGAGTLSFMYGSVGGNVLETQLNLMEKQGTLNILSTPSITTLDNKMAYTENGEKVPYVSKNDDGDNDVKFEDAVLRLEMTPNVIDAANLKLKVLVKKDEVDSSRSVEGNPYIIKKQTETTLIMRSGETVVISGLTKEKGTNTEAGVPGLRNLPGGKYLFGSTNRTISMEEVLIFITPVILPVRSREEYARNPLPPSPPVLNAK